MKHLIYYFHLFINKVHSLIIDFMNLFQIRFQCFNSISIIKSFPFIFVDFTALIDLFIFINFLIFIHFNFIVLNNDSIF
jgi:hypothetical protein